MTYTRQYNQRVHVGPFPLYTLVRVILNPPASDFENPLLPTNFMFLHIRYYTSIKKNVKIDLLWERYLLL